MPDNKLFKQRCNRFFEFSAIQNPKYILFRIERWGFFLAALILAAMCSMLVYHFLNLPQKYDQLIVGNIAWNFTNKYHDYALLFSFVISFFVSLSFILKLSMLLTKALSLDAEAYFHDFLILLSSPACIWVIGLLTTKNDSIWLLCFSGVLLFVGLFFVTLLMIKKDVFWNNDTQFFFYITQTFFLILFAIGFAVASIAIGFNRISALLHVKSWMSEIRFIYILICAFSLGIVYIFCCVLTSNFSNQLKTRFKNILFLCQCFFPVLFLSLIPSMVNLDGTFIVGFAISRLAFCVIGFCIAYAYIDLYRRYKTSIGEGALLRQSIDQLSVICIIGVLLFLKITNVSAPTISSDDYHFGELLVPWWSWTKQHLIPFWDYAPARGLVNYLSGAASNLFFDGKVANFYATEPFVYLGVLLISLPILSKSIGLGPAFLGLFFAPYINYISEIDIINTAFICILCKNYFHMQPNRWFFLYMILSIVVVFFAPGQGGLATISILPIALYKFCNISRDERKTALLVVGVFIIALTLLSITTSFGKMLFAALRYAIEQSNVNSIANGIPWKESFGMTNINPWLFEMMRASWLLVTIWAGIILFKENICLSLKKERVVVLYAITIFIFTFLFVLRATGRIDPGSPSRLGIASIWACSLLLPLLIFTNDKLKLRGAAIFIWLSIVGLVYPHFGGFNTNYHHLFAPQLNPPLRNNGDVNQEIGLSQVDLGHFTRLAKLRRILDKILDPNDTYLDLTGRHATYFYFNRRPPIETGSIYNLITKSQQLRAIKSLEKNKPQAVLISADNILHDGGPASLRANLLYRYILLNYDYKVVKIDGYIWLIKPERMVRLADENIEYVNAINDSPSNILHEVFRVGYLKYIPASWGRSSDSLRDSLIKINQIPPNSPRTMLSVTKLNDVSYLVTGDDPQVRFAISSWHLGGRDVSLIGFDFNCKATGISEPIIEMYWKTDVNPESELTVVRFNGVNGRLLVPMDAAPAWLLAKHILSIRFDVQDQRSCTMFKIDNVTFYQRS